MKSLRMILLLLLSVYSLAGFAERGDKWRVSDQDLTVWDSPSYLNKLGMVHRGYTFEEEAMDGDMIQFLYHGQKAYVATYCCERVVENSEATEVVEVAEVKKPKEPATVVEVSDSSKVSSVATSKTDSDKDGGFNALLAIPLLILGLVGACISLVALVFTFCYVFKYQALADWFNGKCDAAVIPGKRFNKLLLMPVLAAFATALTTGIASWLAGMQEADSDAQMALIALGVVFFLGTPTLVLRHFYVKYKNLYGKQAARWMMVYSLLSIVAIYLLCMLVMYLVIGLLAILVIALIICLAFPTRYYIVRRW